MKSIFDASLRNELIDRIEMLQENSVPQWGKMNIYQMLEHCIFWDEWVQGKNNPVYKQEWMGLIFGKWALWSMVKDDKPLKRNIPAGAKFIIEASGDNIARQKERWMACIAAYAQYSNPHFIHDFFGKMTKEQIGILAYKHADHHLRQFNC